MFGGAWLVAFAAAELKSKEVGILALVAVLRGILSILRIFIFLMFRGKRSAYLYEGGIIWQEDREIKTIAWPHVDELWIFNGYERVWGLPIGPLVAYYLVTFSGQKLPIDAKAAGSRTFGPNLEAAVQRIGRRLVSRYYAPSLPHPMIMGFGSLAALFIVAVVGHNFGALFGWLMLALEIALVIWIFKIKRRLNRIAIADRRQQLAENRGWRFAHTADLSIPGPFTAGRLQAVPNDAVTTTGTNVVWIQVGRFALVVFDQVRAGDPIAWPQTVWLLRDSRFGSANSLDERVIAIPGGAALHWWLEAGVLCAVVNSASYRAASAEQVEAGVGILVRLADQLTLSADLAKQEQ
jgi:hypothetical protein